MTLTNRFNNPTPCAGISWPYDLLTDRTGAEEPAALHKARDLCGDCPIMVACLKENESEPWARAVLGRDHFDAPTVRERQYVPKKVIHRHADRLPELEHLVKHGIRLHEAAKKLNISERSIYKWCHRHRRLDLYRALAPDERSAA